MTKKERSRSKHPRYEATNANGKTHIGQNVFTTEDDAIIKETIASNPDWTLYDIKQAITTVHPMPAIVEHLGRMMSPAELMQHMSKVPASTPSIARTIPERASERMLKPLHTDTERKAVPEHTPESVAHAATEPAQDPWPAAEKIQAKTAEKPIEESDTQKTAPEPTASHRRPRKASKSSHSQWTKDADEVVTTIWPLIGAGLGTSTVWAMLLPDRTTRAVDARAYRLNLQRTNFDTIPALNPKFTAEDNGMLTSFASECGTNPEKWSGVLSQTYSRDEIAQEIAALSVRKVMPKLLASESMRSHRTEQKRVPKRSTKAPQTQTAQTQNDDILDLPNTDNMSTQQMLSKLQELSRDPRVTMTVSIDFGNGIMFNLDNRKEKQE
jgi:hypothetical protein